MVLVDTSVWIDHLRKADRQLQDLLRAAEVLTHSLVIGELACGNLGKRPSTLALFRSLPRAKEAAHEEAMDFIEQHALHGSGVGIVDVHLLASCFLTHVPLWTRDRKLVPIADRLRLKYKG
jgi:predicted nucleic acid-binding protein